MLLVTMADQWGVGISINHSVFINSRQSMANFRQLVTERRRRAAERKKLSARTASPRSIIGRMSESRVFFLPRQPPELTTEIRPIQGFIIAGPVSRLQRRAFNYRRVVIAVSGIRTAQPPEYATAMDVMELWFGAFCGCCIGSRRRDVTAGRREQGGDGVTAIDACLRHVDKTTTWLGTTPAIIIIDLCEQSEIISAQPIYTGVHHLKGSIIV